MILLGKRKDPAASLRKLLDRNTTRCIVWRVARAARLDRERRSGRSAY